MSSDIYNVKELPGESKKNDAPKASRGRRRRDSGKTFEQATNPDLANTHRRRKKNSGLRRFRHQMKKPEFSKAFWITCLSVSGSILIGLFIWDTFLRYPDVVQEEGDLEVAVQEEIFEEVDVDDVEPVQEMPALETPVETEPFVVDLFENL
ncbi:MAG: hypothetical protein HN400_00655 [Nitrospinaceae bacterium]|nr:hypothetical protein [Nitrospinaceae bacterium]